MSTVNKIEVNGVTYDIEDSTARSQSGLTNEAKQALLACFQNVAWINASGQTYYDALENALYPPANLVSIGAVYTQSGTIYTTDSLDSLKPDLVVTAHYSDSTTETVSNYLLSGTLTSGTSTITVSYGGKTTTFNVAVTEYVDSFTYGLVDNSSAITGSYITDTGEIETSTQQSGYYEDYIDLYGRSSVVIHYVPSAGSTNYRISVYDANKVFTRQLHLTENAYETVTLQSGERYIRLGWYLGSTSYTCNFYIQSTSPTALQMEIGDISGSTGEDTSSTTRVRSIDYIPASGSITIEDCPWGTWNNWTGSGAGGGYFFRCYDSSKTIVGTLIGTSNTMYKADQKNLTLPTNTAYVRMELQKTGSSTTISSGFTANTHPFAIDGVSYQVTEG